MTSARLQFVLLTCLLPALAPADEINVAVAANFAPTLEVLQKEFEATTLHKLLISAGSSGKLYAQTTNGAPFDVFLAADQDYPRRMEELGHVVRGTRFTYAVGRLVLWSKGKRVSPDLHELLEPDIRFIAIANPRTAPYGRAAERVMNHFHVADRTREKWVMGENVGQVVQFVATGNAQAGFVALAQLSAFGEAERGNVLEIPETSHAPLYQDAVLLRRAPHAKAAAEFLKFLRSDAARAQIKKSGYNLPTATR